MQRENQIAQFLSVLGGQPDGPGFTALKAQIEQDVDLREAWFDFVVEQYVAGQLNTHWRDYAEKIPGFSDRLRFITDINDGISRLHDQELKGEVRNYLPRRTAPDLRRHVRRRFILKWGAAAAIVIALVVAGLLMEKSSTEPVIVEGIPVLMVEPFELEGVTEEMIVRGIPQQVPVKLAAHEGIHPITSFAVQHAGTRVVPESVARELNADYTVRGKVRQTQSAYVIQARLVNTNTNRPVWKSQFTVAKDIKSLDDFQDELALNITETLKINVSPDARKRMSREISGDALATEYFLKAERLWADRTEESLLESIKLLEMARALDSTSTTIGGYLSLAYATYAENDWGNEYWKPAKRTAEQVLIADPENPEALVVLGDYAESQEKDYLKAAAFFEQALQARPGDAKIHQAIAELHLRTGFIENGMSHIEIARILEPEHRVVRWVETKYLTAMGMLEQAKEAAEDLVKMYPDYPNIQNFDWQYYLTKGEHNRAIMSIPEYDSANQWRSDYMQAITFIDQGDEIAFREVYDKLDPGLRPSLDLLWYVQTDQWKEAHDLLKDLLAGDAFHLLAIMQTSDFAIFRKMKKDPGIVDLIARYGIRVHQIPSVVEDI